jgi:hypothetical protein
MQGNVVRFVTLDFILRIFRARVVGIALPRNILRMHIGDRAGDVPRLRVPDHVISNGKRMCPGFLHRNLPSLRFGSTRGKNTSEHGRSLLSSLETLP